VTGTVNAARQGSGGRQKRSPYRLVVLACGSTIYPLKPAQAQASRATGRAPTRPNAACCTCVLTARRRSRSRFASATRRPRLPTGIGWSALPRIGSVPPDGSPTAVRQRIRLSAPRGATLHRVLRRRRRPRLNRVSGAQLWLGHASAQLSCLRRPRMIAPAVASCSATSSPSSS
jgi:hypothetical protein